ncbi:MAG: stage II sporulation protein P [Lachnospiraceae bacterium]
MKRLRFLLKEKSVVICVMLCLILYFVISLFDYDEMVDRMYQYLFPTLYYNNLQLQGEEFVERGEWLPTSLMECLFSKRDQSVAVAKKTAQTKEKAQEQDGFTDAQLSSHDYLLKYVYNVDSSTVMTGDLLDAPNLMKMNLGIPCTKKKPKVLIYHTHGSEEYRSSSGKKTVIDVGETLAATLEEDYGIGVYHDKRIYDVVDGKLDRSRAYTQAALQVGKLLEKYPSIDVVIDLHRDGVAEGTRLVTEVDGKPTAQLMFFNGISRLSDGSPIAYLDNPYIKENLAFSLQLQNAALQYYDGLTRRIYVRGYRYNLHLKPRTLLVEVGAQTNTIEEAENAMKPFAHILSIVLDK